MGPPDRGSSVDDDASVRAMLGYLLRTRVTTCGRRPDGAEALGDVAVEGPDCMVLD